MDREIETHFPFEDYEDLLLNWAVTYTLNQNKYTTPVFDCIEQGGPGAVKFKRLRELISQNLSYVVFQAIKDFKAELSSAPEAVLDIPELDVDIRMTRAEFETLIGDQLAKVEEALDDTLARAGLDRQAIDIVLCTGGSSLIPAVRRILEEHFPSRVVEHDPFTNPIFFNQFQLIYSQFCGQFRHCCLEGIGALGCTVTLVCARRRNVRIIAFHFESDIVA